MVQTGPLRISYITRLMAHTRRKWDDDPFSTELLERTPCPDGRTASGGGASSTNGTDNTPGGGAAGGAAGSDNGASSNGLPQPHECPQQPVQLYQQCAGTPSTNWNGCTNCASGSKCYAESDSECLDPYSFSWMSKKRTDGYGFKSCVPNDSAGSATGPANPGTSQPAGSNSSGDCQLNLYDQCGGNGWTGCTKCGKDPRTGQQLPCRVKDQGTYSVFLTVQQGTALVSMLRRPGSSVDFLTASQVTLNANQKANHGMLRDEGGLVRIGWVREQCNVNAGRQKIDALGNGKERLHHFLRTDILAAVSKETIQFSELEKNLWDLWKLSFNVSSPTRVSGAPSAPSYPAPFERHKM